MKGTWDEATLEGGRIEMGAWMAELFGFFTMFAIWIYPDTCLQ